MPDLSFREILETHPIASLRRHVRNSNINGYGHLGKQRLIDLMLTYADRFIGVGIYVSPAKEERLTSLSDISAYRQRVTYPLMPPRIPVSYTHLTLPTKA